MEIKTQSTVEPTTKLSLEEWLAEFRIGIMAPKPINDRPKQMMIEYDFKKLQVQSDSNYVIAF